MILPRDKRIALFMFCNNFGVDNAGARDSGSRSSRLFKKLHEARYHRDKNAEGKGPAQKLTGKGATGGGGGGGGGGICSFSGAATSTMGAGLGGVDQILACEVPTLSEGPSSAIPGPSQTVIKVRVSARSSAPLLLFFHFSFSPRIYSFLPLLINFISCVIPVTQNHTTVLEPPLYPP